MPSHADNHDRDKLLRWHGELKNSQIDAPPVFAIFLVSEVDRAAHDVFRSFRSSFEEHQLGFEHLVIFGQHGVSATARQVRDKFGLQSDGGPSVILFSGDGDQPLVVQLPEGEAGGAGKETEAGWQNALEQAVTAVENKAWDESASVEALRELCTELAGMN